MHALRVSLRFGLWLTIVAAILLGVLLASAHARDRYWIGIASGSWLAQAWTANNGAFYPPLRDDEGHFAGTRYMPLHIVMHAGVARLTGEYLLSGRVIGFTAAMTWLAAIAALARSRGCPRPLAGALAASVLLSPVGVQAVCTIRGDGLALALQLWAVWIIARAGESRRLPSPAADAAASMRIAASAALIAGLLCAAAILTKLFALWAPAAIGCWLLWRDRRALVIFWLTLAMATGAGALAANLVSDGRFLQNLTTVSGTGWRGWGSVLVWSPRRLLGFIGEWSPATWLLLAPAAIAVLLALARRRLNVLHLAWLACVGVLLVMFADVGVGENHILEIAAITAVMIADLWSAARPSPTADARANIDDPADAEPNRGHASGQSRRVDGASSSIAQLIIVAALIWLTAATVVQHLLADVGVALAALRSGPRLQDDPRAFDALVRDRTFLSDDPSIAVLLDQRPLIADAFIFRGFEFAQPQWVEELEQRILRGGFDVVILTQQADPTSWWYSELFLGRRIVGAIAQRYTLDGQRGEHWVYVPNPPAGSE